MRIRRWGWIWGVMAAGMAAVCGLAPCAVAATDYFVRTNGNDAATGGSWADAFRTISNAMAKASDTDTITVSNGIYRISTRVLVNKAVTLQSEHGAAHTVITRSGGNIGILCVSNAAATVDGFSITNGYLPGSTANDVGGVLIYAGTLQNSTISGNYGYYGGGVSVRGACLIRNCLIVDNTAKRTGGGIDNRGDATVRNCLIAGNKTTEYYGAGVLLWYSSSGVVYENCTITDNRGPGGGISHYYNSGVTQKPVFRNTILYGNYSGVNEMNYHVLASSANFSNNCVKPLIGVNSTEADPQFIDAAAKNYRLLPGSPCTNAGADQAWMGGAFDLDGNLRKHGTVDIGAYEFTPGPLLCNFKATPLSGLDPLAVTYAAYTGGTNLNGLYYRWDIDNDTVVDAAGTDRQTVLTNLTAGTYTTTLTVTNAAGESATLTRSAFVKVAPATAYVVPVNPAAEYPYSSWAKAATNIQAAVDAGIDGTLVLVSNGTYRIRDPIAMSGFGVTLRSVNGPEWTKVVGNLAQPTGTNRCFYVTHVNAVVDGFTIVNGKRPGTTTASNGGGLYLIGTVQNCVIVSNTAYYGAGIDVSGGKVLNCIVKGNSAQRDGGGLRIGSGCTVRNCLIANNTCGEQFSGGIFSYYADNTAVIENCTIVSNRLAGIEGPNPAPTQGPTVRNTIIYNNRTNLYLTTGLKTTYFKYNCIRPAAGTPCITNAPMFKDAAMGDYRLGKPSLCIDAGTNVMSWMASAVDLDGNPRVINGRRLGFFVDIGAYEFAPAKGTVLLLQ